MAIREYDYLPDSPISIIGELTTGQTVTIEVWQDGVAVVLTSDVCSEIDATGKYSWSTINLPVLPTDRAQYHWRMDDGAGNTVEDDFILQSIESTDGKMPSLRDPDSYILQI